MPEEISNPLYAAPRTRRTYTAQFKLQLVTACLQPGSSIAALAREHGMNANVLHRWLKEHRAGMHQCAIESTDSNEQPAQQTSLIALPPAGSPACAVRDVEVTRSASAFVALDLRQSTAQTPNASELTSVPADSSPIASIVSKIGLVHSAGKLGLFESSDFTKFELGEVEQPL